MLQTFKKNINIYLLIFLIIILNIIFHLQSEYFFTLNNISNILEKSSLNLIVASGMTFIICTGGIDLSIGSNLALTGYIIAILLRITNPIIAILIGLIFSTTLGYLNGWLISRFKLNPFISTLSTMSIFRGLTILISKGQPIYNFPELYIRLGSQKFSFFSIPIIVSYSLTIILGIILAYTKFGNYVYALGNNSEALKKCGINNNKILRRTYAIGGLVAGVAAVVMSARLNTAEPLAGMNIEMDAIAIAVLGGVSIKGGKGNMKGVILAAFLLATISNGLTIIDISSNYQQLLSGLIILTTVIISEKKNRYY